MSVINFTDGGNITSIGRMVSHSNELTGGMFGIVIVLAVGIITLLGTGNRFKSQSFSYASFMMFLTSVFMWMLNACSLNDVFVFSAVLGFTILILYIDKGGA